LEWLREVSRLVVGLDDLEGDVATSDLVASGQERFGETLAIKLGVGTPAANCHSTAGSDDQTV
jgi:hypothetical protein